MGIISEQSVYNLSNRAIELEVIPACRDLGISLLPWSPLASGVLAGISGKEKKGRKSGNFIKVKIFDTKKLYQEKIKQIEKYHYLCDELGEEPANIALAWLINNPVVAAPVIGPRTLEHLENSVKALDVKISQDVSDKLDKIWPGMGGEAPEAYTSF